MDASDLLDTNIFILQWDGAEPGTLSIAYGPQHGQELEQLRIVNPFLAAGA